MNAKNCNGIVKGQQDLNRSLCRMFPNRARFLTVSKSVTLALLLCGFALAMGGCADFPVVGFSTGSYYTPNYRSYYGDYGYRDESYSPYGTSYNRVIVVGGVRHHGYYGGHHIRYDSRRYYRY